MTHLGYLWCDKPWENPLTSLIKAGFGKQQNVKSARTAQNNEDCMLIHILSNQLHNRLFMKNSEDNRWKGPMNPPTWMCYLRCLFIKTEISASNNQNYMLVHILLTSIYVKYHENQLHNRLLMKNSEDQKWKGPMNLPTWMC